MKAQGPGVKSQASRQKKLGTTPHHTEVGTGESESPWQAPHQSVTVQDIRQRVRGRYSVFRNGHLHVYSSTHTHKLLTCVSLNVITFWFRFRTEFPTISQTATNLFPFCTTQTYVVFSAATIAKSFNNPWKNWRWLTSYCMKFPTKTQSWAFCFVLFDAKPGIKLAV